MTDKTLALKISLTYLLFGILWILLSDSLLKLISPTKDYMTLISIIKGWVFVSLSAYLIYFLSSRYLAKLTFANRRLQVSYNDLTATHEELTATEEELRQQFDKVLAANEMTHNQTAILSTLQELTTGLINNLDVDTLLLKIVQDAAKLAATPHGFIYLWDKEKETILLKVGLGLFEDQIGLFEISANSGQTGHVFQTGQLSIINNYETWEHRLNAPHLATVKSVIQVPLKSKKAVIGTIGLALTDESVPFSQFFAKLLEKFAALASIALENAQLHTQLQLELEELEKKEESIHSIFDATNDAIIVHDAESGDIYTVNSKAIDLFGYTLEEFKSKGALAVDCVHNKNNALASIRNAAKEGPQLIEWTIKNSSGQHLDVEVNLKMAVIYGRKCVLASIRDISERKKAADKLAQSQTQKLALLDAIPDLFLLFNQEGIALDYKLPSNFMVLVPPKECIGHSVNDLLPPELALRYKANINKAIESGETQLFEYKIIIATGERWREGRFVKCGDSEACHYSRYN